MQPTPTGPPPQSNQKEKNMTNKQGHRKPLMATDWCVPGEGATVGELRKRLGLDASFADSMRTNLRIVRDDERFEGYDIDRAKAAIDEATKDAAKIAAVARVRDSIARGQS